jgi:arabinose-5-phosphate isomerase
MDRLISRAKEVFELEAEAINGLLLQINNDFSEAVKAILNCSGRVIVGGIGKSGIIGQKISSTLSSTGTPSLFMHPSEAFHGDLGIVKKNDVILLISYSGQTEEVLKIVPFFQKNGNVLISMTGNSTSSLAQNSHYHLKVSVKREACPLQMVPTASTTVALAMGDALAVVLMKEKGITIETFAKVHPGGSIGRKLLNKVEDVMITKDLPVVTKESCLKEVINVMTSSHLGTAVVVEESGCVIGIITDGDLRRALNRGDDVLNLTSEQIMNKNPITVSKDKTIHEAEKLLLDAEIITLIICDDEGKLRGLVPFHDL